jgi:hypothetical protein
VGVPLDLCRVFVIETLDRVANLFAYAEVGEGTFFVEDVSKGIHFRGLRSLFWEFIVQNDYLI